MKNNLGLAIRAWKKVIGVKRVLTDHALLALTGTATFRTTQRVLAILKPATTAEVSAVMRIATRYGVPVYPVSGGKNWGLGSKVPQRNGVLIDLSGMKKISGYNDTMGYMTVQPGVTFGAGVEFLRRKNSSRMLDTIGSTPDASIIGNTAERGHGMGLYADRFNFVCALEVVLPDGTIIKTGFEDFKKSKLGALTRWGVGPYVDGLFTQSNLGIITGLTIWLRAKPAHFTSFTFYVDDERRLGKVIDAWRELGLQGLQSSMRVFNDIRMIAFGTRFPEGQEKPLSDDVRKVIRNKLKIGKWIGLGGLYPPSAAHALADRALIESRIGPLVDHLEFFDQSVADNEYETADPWRKNQIDFMFNRTLLRGNVSESGINMTYWRKPSTVVMKDLHLDNVGVLWFCPAIPMTAKDVQQSIAICERTCKKYGFELNMGFLFISERTLDITGALCYDRNVKGEDDKAMRCHDELMRLMLDKGYSPYRLGVQSMHLMKHQHSSTIGLHSRIKKTLDPGEVLAPGHYIG